MFILCYQSKSDKTIKLRGQKSKRLYPEPLRLVEYYDDEKDIVLVFLTIKKLWGHSENAVNLHVWLAISIYLIVAYVKYQLKSTLSIYKVMQILGISAFDKTPLKELLTETQFNQNVQEQNDYLTFKN